MITSATFATTEGDTQINYAALTNVNVLELRRQGLELDRVTGTPSGRQFKYIPRSGYLEFDATIPFEANEKIFVLYEY